MSVKKLQLGVAFLIVFFVGFFIGTNKVSLDWKNYKPSVTVVNKEPPSSASLVDFSLFWSVWDKLTSNYYDKTMIDPQKLLYGAISGMVSAVGDPYTMFLPPQQQTSFQQQLAGQFTGIGAELGMKDNHIIVVAPLDGSPAQKAGIKAGDTIVGVDGKSVASWTLPQAVDKIRGPKGTTVTLTVVHKDDQKTTDIVITRGVITVKSIDGWVKPISKIDAINQSAFSDTSTQIMYLRLSQFGDNTNQDWQNLMNSLSAQVANGSVKGVILDVRNNPGGYLTD